MYVLKKKLTKFVQMFTSVRIVLHKNDDGEHASVYNGIEKDKVLSMFT